MQYWDIVTRSFRISWRYRYLWLIALFSGEGGGGFNFSYSQRSTASSSDVANFQHQVTTWISDHVGLIVLLAILWLVLVVAFFILGAVCEGATIRAAAEHDAERQFGLGWAWRSGVATMWAIVRFRLLLIALGLPVVVILGGLIAAIVVAFVSHNQGAGAALIVLTVLVALASIPYLIYLSFLDRLGSRALVLEQLGARAAIVRAHRLLFKRLGRTLLVWLLQIAVGIVLAIILVCFSAIVIAPFLVIGGLLSANGPSGVWVIAVIGLLILVPLFLLVSAFLAAQSSTYWTLAFRRLDLDPAPPTTSAAPAAS